MSDHSNIKPNDVPESVRLLLVDDQPANLKALEAILAPLGHTLVQAESGAAALKYLLKDDFAAILLDVRMPGMDGFETASLIKQREKSRYIPILFVTAVDDEEKTISQAYSAGAVDFLSKPYNPDVLKCKVSVFVDLYRHREQIRHQNRLLQESAQREMELRRTVAEREREQRYLEELARQEAEKAALAREVEALSRQQRVFVREVLSSLTEGRLHLCDTEVDLPAALPPFQDPIPLTSANLRLLRGRLIAAATEVGWPTERLQDFETAVGEAAMNAVVHGRDGFGQVCMNPATGMIQVWVRDRGTGIAQDRLHRATLERGYTTAGTLGHGFWMMLKTADHAYLLTGTGGTTLVLEQGALPPPPRWMTEYDQPAFAPRPESVSSESRTLDSAMAMMGK